MKGKLIPLRHAERFHNTTLGHSDQLSERRSREKHTPLARQDTLLSPVSNVEYNSTGQSGNDTALNLSTVLHLNFHSSPQRNHNAKLSDGTDHLTIPAQWDTPVEICRTLHWLNPQTRVMFAYCNENISRPFQARKLMQRSLRCYSSYHGVIRWFIKWLS